MVAIFHIPLAADPLDSAISQQQQIEQQKQQAQKVLDNLDYEEDAIQTKLTTLNAQITQAEKNLEQKNAQLLKLSNQLDQAQSDLAAKQAELNGRQQVFATRVKEMYVEGNDFSFLNVLFAAESLDDFISKAEYFECLVRFDHNLVAEIEADRQEINEKVNNLQFLTEQAAALKKAAQQETDKLNSNKSQQQSLLKQVQADAQAQSDEISQMEAQSAALTQEIHALQAQYNKGGATLGQIVFWPLPGHFTITDPYGPRVNPITHKTETHTGVDLAATTGTPIYAAGDGIVLIAGYSAPWGAYGNMVLIDHGNGTVSLYGHQSKVAVSQGDKVKAGQLIGYVGSTGWSTGPHLHFEIRVNDQSVNPLRYFN